MFINYIFRICQKTFKNIINYLIDLKSEIEPLELIEMMLIVFLLDFFNDEKMSLLKNYVIIFVIIACCIKIVNRKRMKKD